MCKLSLMRRSRPLYPARFAGAQQFKSASKHIPYFNSAKGGALDNPSNADFRQALAALFLLCAQ
jgi:hypothetical protein